MADSVPRLADSLGHAPRACTRSACFSARSIQTMSSPKTDGMIALDVSRACPPRAQWRR